MLLGSDFLLQERQFNSVRIDHVRGFIRNDLANDQNRGYDQALVPRSCLVLPKTPIVGPSVETW